MSANGWQWLLVFLNVLMGVSSIYYARRAWLENTHEEYFAGAAFVVIAFLYLIFDELRTLNRGRWRQ